MSGQAEEDGKAMPETTEIALRRPVQRGKDETITRLVLRPATKHFRTLTLPMKGEGENATIDFQPYHLAKVGLRMAGQPDDVLDRMHPADMMEVATTVLGFLGAGPTGGPTG